MGMEELFPAASPRSGEKKAAPPRAKNPMKGEKIVHFTQKDLEGLYSRIEKYMHPDLKEYYNSILTGDGTLDAVKESEMLVRLLSVFATRVIENGIAESSVSRDMASLITEFRLSIKDFEEMNRKRQEVEIKHGNDGRTVDPLRESALGRFESIAGNDSRKSA